MRLICWLIGHNKIQEIRHRVNYIEYFDVCTQCHKSWKNKQLSDLPKMIKKPVKVITKPNLQKLVEKPILIKKTIVNFYVL